jgi:hypothetical protein
MGGPPSLGFIGAQNCTQRGFSHLSSRVCVWDPVGVARTIFEYTRGKLRKFFSRIAKNYE